MARRGGMSRSWSAGVGWLRPGAAASRFGRPGCVAAGWARFDRGRPMTAAFLDFLGWEQLTAAEQASAVGGACLGLTAWLAARVVFGGRRQR